MATIYKENPLIFLNTTDQSIPHGRNVRVQQRAQTAAPASNQAGKMIIFESKSSSGNTKKKYHRVRQRRKAAKQQLQQSPSRCSSRDYESQNAPLCTRSLSLYSGRKTSLNTGRVKPGDLIALAACHVRRMSAINLRTRTTRVLDVLRCRQWSTISLNFDGLGTTPFLDGAVRCLEAKLRQIAFDNISPLLVLTEYDRALQCLHGAMREYNPSNSCRVLTAIQLLAIFEMLDGPENPSWQQHVSGAWGMFELQIANSDRLQRCVRRPLVQLAPLLADALLENNCDFFQKTPWKSLLDVLICKQSSPEQRQDLDAIIDCFTNLPDLMVEIKQLDSATSLGVRFEILSRAQGMRYVIKSALVEGKMSSFERNTDGARFDILGLSMASLFALDRIIAAVVPHHLEVREFVPGKTDEVCIRLLQSESIRMELRTAMEAMLRAEQRV